MENSKASKKIFLDSVLSQLKESSHGKSFTRWATLDSIEESEVISDDEQETVNCLVFKGKSLKGLKVSETIYGASFLSLMGF